MRRLLWVNLETSSFDNRRTQKACSFPSYDYFVPELGKCEPPHHIFSWSWDICFTPTCYQWYRRVSISWLRTSSEPISWLPLSRTTPHRLSGKKIIHVPVGRATAPSCWARWIADSSGSPPALQHHGQRRRPAPRPPRGPGPGLGSALLCSRARLFSSQPSFPPVEESRVESLRYLPAVTSYGGIWAELGSSAVLGWAGDVFATCTAHRSVPVGSHNQEEVMGLTVQ